MPRTIEETLNEELKDMQHDVDFNTNQADKHRDIMEGYLRQAEHAKQERDKIAYLIEELRVFKGE